MNSDGETRCKRCGSRWLLHDCEPILPSMLAVGDVIEWKTETGTGTAAVRCVYVDACLLGYHGGPVLYDKDAARLAIKIVRRAT